MTAPTPELDERYPDIDGPLDHRVAYVLRSGVFSSPIAVKTFKDLIHQRDQAFKVAAEQRVLELHHHDIEAYSASFNEGWDEAVNQGLAAPRGALDQARRELAEQKRINASNLRVMTEQLDLARQQIADAPHTKGCFEDSFDYGDGCRCWKADL